MKQLVSLVQDFLAQERIAVAGISRTREDAANIIYRKLKDTGYHVFPVNPNAQTFEGDASYSDLKSITDKVDGVVIVTRPEVTEQIVRECAEVGVPRVWMHRSLGFLGSSVSQKGVDLCREKNIAVIAGGCPMMFCEPVDLGHKCMRWMVRLTGGLSK